MVFSIGNDDLFYFPKVFMKFGGFWPTDRQTTVSVATFCFNLALQITIFMTMLVVWLRNDNWRENNFPTFQDLLIIIATYVIIGTHGNQMVPLIEAADDVWSSITDTEEQEIMRTHKKMGSHYFVFLFACHVVLPTGADILYTFCYYLEAYISPEARTVFTDHFVWNAFKPLLKDVMYFLGSMAFYGTDLLFWSLAMQLSAQFKIQSLRCQRFLQIKSKSKSRKLFRRLIERHNQVLDLYGIFEDAFHPFIALRVLTLQAVIMVLVYEAAVDFDVPIVVPITLALVTMAHFSSLYVFYYAGDYLTSCSEEVGEVLRQCKWYTLSKDSRINFSIVILRTQATRPLTVGKLYKLNLLSFQFVTQAIYSYISLVVAKAHEERERFGSRVN